MSIDDDTRATSETDRLLRELDKPSLANLAYALRHPETWPEGFIWDYSYCKQCAMGLAHSLWKGSIEAPSNDRKIGSSRMARNFALPYTAAWGIFFGAGHAYPTTKKTWLGRVKTVPRSNQKVTPEMVADAIEKHLARPD